MFCTLSKAEEGAQCNCISTCLLLRCRTHRYIHFLRVYKIHLKMVKGCRIDTGSCKKPLSKKDSPKTLGTRVSCKTGTGLAGQRARQV